jgi:phenylalanyl-tRNA synthetase beta chain
MRIPWSWLRTYVETESDLDPDAWAERFPHLGLGVEAVERDGADVVFDLEITTNRPDWLSLIGVAREVVAATGGALRRPDAVVAESGAPASDQASVTVEDPELCPRYAGRVIGVDRIGPSPFWMQQRLEQAGVRAINTVVDVTNYVMLETGQPLHAFDLDTIPGGSIVVRAARAGEGITTLDGVSHALPLGALVIADRERPIAVGGVMGGADTEITAGTRRVFLESAWFNGRSVRRTARALGLRTEASARHERGGEPERLAYALDRAAALIAELASGSVAPGVVDVYPNPEPRRAVAVRLARVARVLGASPEPAEAVGILDRLGFAPRFDGERIVAEVPPHRRDVQREEDLIEEIARLWGYDRIPETMPSGAAGASRVAPAVAAEAAARGALLRSGLTEVFTLSLVHPRVFDALRLPATDSLRDAIAIRNPLTEEHTHLRTTMLPSLLEVLRTNRTRGTADVAVFEIGRVYRHGDDGGSERKVIAIAAVGHAFGGRWNVAADAAELTFFHVKGLVETLFDLLHVPAWDVQPALLPFLHPGRAAAVAIGGAYAGWLGEVHPDAAERYDLRGRAFAAEIDLAAAVARAGDWRPYAPVPRMPAVERDLAAVVPASVTSAALLRVVREAAGPSLEHVEPFDVYAGAAIPSGMKSVAIAMRFRDAERTLEAADVEGTLEAVRSALRNQLGAQIRGA